MSSLKMEMNPDGKSVDDELLVEAPYDFLVGFVASEVGHSIDAAESWLGSVARALAGTPVESCEGNAWRLDADAATATLTNEYVGPPWHVGTLPTPMLAEVLERWVDFLKASGKGYRQELLPA